MDIHFNPFRLEWGGIAHRYCIRYILVHLPRKADKQEMLLHMLRKVKLVVVQYTSCTWLMSYLPHICLLSQLFRFAQGACLEENADALSNHELLLVR